jgi:CheY-like chemotaxis protein
MESIAKILIADDDASCRKTTSALLKSFGYECHCAASGQEACVFLENGEFDLLISDIEMPGNRDLHLIETLPQVQAGLPVILMTGYPTVQTAVQSIGLSVTAYLIKPVDPEVLLEKVAHAVDLARHSRNIRKTRNRLLGACEDLKRIETAFRGTEGSDPKASLGAFFDLTMQNIAASLLDMRQIFETMVQTSDRGPDAEWLQSARPLVLVNILRETIAVLAKTKSSFKSKELAELRRKLESALQETPALERETSAI